jgi:hypothetical protein
MSTSPSPRRGAKPPPRPASRFPKGLILIGGLAALAVLVFALPASLAARFLPASIRADDFSGSLWHGSAGHLTFNGRSAGAVEWRLHPWSLLRLSAVADLHWVRIGFVADASANIDARGLTLRDVEGGGPIEDLRDLGIADAWGGNAAFKFREIRVAFGGGNGAVLPESAVGDLSVSNLSSPAVANGADLGGYTLHMANASITPGADATADLSDTGGPLEIQGTIRIAAGGRTGILSGTIRARPGAAPALRAQVDQLSQLHARDAQGRIPVEVEFTL